MTGGTFRLSLGEGRYCNGVTVRYSNGFVSVGMEPGIPETQLLYESMGRGHGFGPLVFRSHDGGGNAVEQPTACRVQVVCPLRPALHRDHPIPERPRRCMRFISTGALRLVLGSVMFPAIGPLSGLAMCRGRTEATTESLQALSFLMFVVIAALLR